MSESSSDLREDDTNVCHTHVNGPRVIVAVERYRATQCNINKCKLIFYLSVERKKEIN